MNIGVDANHENPVLLKKVQEVISKLQYSICKMILNGIEAGEIKRTVNPEKYARYFFTMIEGAVFMTATMNDESYLQETMNRLDDMIVNELAI